MDVEVAVINKMKSRGSLHLRTDDSDTDELAGVLDPHDDKSLNDAIAKVVAKDGDTIVVTSEAGEVAEEVSIDTSKGGALASRSPTPQPRVVRRCTTTSQPPTPPRYGYHTQYNRQTRKR